MTLASLIESFRKLVEQQLLAEGLSLTEYNIRPCECGNHSILTVSVEDETLELGREIFIPTSADALLLNWQHQEVSDMLESLPGEMVGLFHTASATASGIETILRNMFTGLSGLDGIQIPPYKGDPRNN